MKFMLSNQTLSNREKMFAILNTCLKLQARPTLSELESYIGYILTKNSFQNVEEYFEYFNMIDILKKENVTLN